MEMLEKTILIIEDDEGLQSQLKWHFDEFDTTIATASNLQEAITAVRLYQPNIIIQDLGLPPDEEGVSEGFRCIQEILNLSPQSKIIVLTGKNEHRNALKAIEVGAYDFYFKPVDTDVLDHVVNQAYKIFTLEAENKLNNQLSEPVSGVVTANQPMRNICRMIEKIAQTNVTATLIGESGTGKEVLARAIHNSSDEKDNPFVAINCAAVPENLMESELFGHEKGAFTGAVSTTIGKVEQAKGGTLFLDEIGDMPLALQAKLLRFLQERSIERVGGRKEIKVNLRVVCATNKNLEAMVKEGTFREDLYYRVGEIIVEIPPLRARGNDVILIANHLLKRYAKQMSTKQLSFSDDAINAMESYDWPGNIREVENKIKRAVVLAENNVIQVEDLALPQTKAKPSVINLKEARRIAEVEAIYSALELSQQNISAAAKLLGVTRPTLYDMMRKYNLSIESSHS
ncbi:PEP-CTERM-box response regulator transcription factor [Saccharospirillum sp. MSK14-1]|uniref:PEP-CTERM-box response regulator transcription factor n=1 Tax=Saccharospirillum sp. MSK14-1 TaxID=1897632 RepID=UPI000D368D14|nr:PEP-CTERM-box response regulator transcription factor [Saccharospirillum sp. MSK14-1]PTY38539.1 PEP-CTERM-box response regulator transcription factor [Saccharospirillum sp. MSK14-1]